MRGNSTAPFHSQPDLALRRAAVLRLLPQKELFAMNRCPVPSRLVRRLSPLVAALALSAVLTACHRADPQPEVVRAVKLMTVGGESSAHMQEYAGVIAARTESRLGFRVAGKLTQRAVDVGQRVQAGQVLAQLDAQDYRLAADAARAQVTAATTQRDLAQADVGRYRALREKNFISAAEMDRREAQLKGAQATLDQARAQLATQSNQAAYTQLVADAAGVITGVDAEVGQVVSAGAPVVRLARDGARDAVFAVPEDQVPLFRPGTAMQVRSWATGQSLAGQVREVAAAADPVSRTYAVKVALNGETAPALGATVYARLDAIASGPALIGLPTSALRESGGKTEVWVYDPKAATVQTRAVTVAGMDGNQVRIAQGLKPGEQVVVAGVHVLTHGQVVRVYQPKGEQNPAAGSNTASASTAENAGVNASAAQASAAGGAAVSAVPVAPALGEAALAPSAPSASATR